MKFSDLMKESHERAVSKGFYDPVPSVDERICLWHSEVSEALEAYRDGHMITTFNSNNKPEGFPSELADIVIRIADCSEWLKLPIIEELQRRVFSDEVSILSFQKGREITSVTKGLAKIHSLTSMVYDRYCHFEKILPADVVSVLVWTGFLANYLDIDLEREIQLKSQYNESRPHKHGRQR